MSDLKQCPFCGGGWLYETRRNGYCDETPTMFCNSCKAVVTWEQVEEEGVNDKTKAFVREHWNSRAPIEYESWFYLPKPKEGIVDYGEPEITRTENGYKVRQIADIVDEAARRWGEELGEYVMQRICEIWNSRAERTCRNLDKHHNIMFKCSECGHWECQDFDGEKILPQTWNYCPNCGCKVVGE